MFQVVAHQADIAVEIEAESRAGLFKVALEAVIYLLTGTSQEQDQCTLCSESFKHRSKNIEITSGGFDDEERIIGLMNELLYACQVRGFYPMKAGDIRFDEKENVTAQVEGLASGHGIPLQREIKAATFHDLSIRTEPMWRVKVVLDV